MSNSETLASETPQAIYVLMAQWVGCYHRARQSQDTIWQDTYQKKLQQVCRAQFPHGSSFDLTSLDLSASSEELLVFRTSFHHMNDRGSYDRWTEHQIRVTASLAFGFKLRITGRDHRQIKDYIHECFDLALRTRLKPETL